MEVGSGESRLRNNISCATKNWPEVVGASTTNADKLEVQAISPQLRTNFALFFSGTIFRFLFQKDVFVGQIST